MRFFSVFSGIGGFDLGLQRAGWECVGQCEIDPYCAAALEKHWPNVWRWRDVKTLSGQLILDNCGRVDALVGGPPCQPSSVAGQRRGAADDRWLWPDFLRLVSEVKPMWVLAENPRGVLSLDVEGLQFSEWLAREFENRGYSLMPVELAAEDVGAPHRRERVWFVGYAQGERFSRIDGRGILAGIETPAERQANYDDIDRSGAECVAITTSDGRREGRAESARQQGRLDAAVRGSDVADAHGGRQLQPQGRVINERRRVENGGGQWPARPGENQREWEEPRVVAAQSAMGLATHGIPGGLARWRVAALKACGNAVVPQCGEVLGRMINRFVEAEC